MQQMKKPLIICSIFVFSVACVVLVIEVFTAFIDTFTPTMRLSIAQYPEGYFVQSGDVFVDFMTPRDIGEKVADFYIETADGRRFFLPNLSEEDAIEILKSNTNAPFEYTVDNYGKDSFTYSNGQERFKVHPGSEYLRDEIRLNQGDFVGFRSSQEPPTTKIFLYFQDLPLRLTEGRGVLPPFAIAST